MSDRTPLEELARTITHERMRHYGYTDEQLTRLEAFTEADHVAAGCLNYGYGWNHDDPDRNTCHADLDELDDTADFVMFVLESAGLAAHDAETYQRGKDAGWIACAEAAVMDEAAIRADEREKERAAAQERLLLLVKHPLTDEDGIVVKEYGCPICRGLAAARGGGGE